MKCHYLDISSFFEKTAVTNTGFYCIYTPILLLRLLPLKMHLQNYHSRAINRIAARIKLKCAFIYLVKKI